MLLALGGVKSLKSLGNLYKNDGDFSKREQRVAMRTSLK
jgi:hypothetical protein